MQLRKSLFAITLMFFMIGQSLLNVFSQEEDESDNYDDLYAKDYDQTDLAMMTIQNYYLKEIIKNRQIINPLYEDEIANIIPFQLDSSKKIAFVMPTFTMAAYDNYKDDSFYTFYKKYAGVSENEFVTTDLDLLTASIPNITEAYLNARSDGLKFLANRILSTSPNIDISFLTDKDLHYGLVFDNNNHNIYDIIILGHQEYVTQEEYDNFRKFVENGGILILFNSNIFYTEVAYNPVYEEITLVQGHSWAFDGDKAWLSVMERWKTKTSEWIGSNFFNCGQGCHIDFKNNPFSYVQHEEQYITNPNVNILIDYKAQSMYNILIAAYELEYGKGKVISFGIFGDDIIHNKEFLRFFDQLFFSHVSLV
ncbi:MAG: N,N-dimethylformamidase beta subunit family domain-containing protein [Nitrososphaeraceae archaeon]